MNSRTRFLITATVLCHLLVALPLVTSQLLPQKSGKKPARVAGAAEEQDVEWKAAQQELVGPVAKLSGNVEIHYAGYVLKADEVTYNRDTGEATADGHVILEGGINDEHVEATHANYNIRAQVGKFEHVNGTIGWHPHPRRLALTSSSPFIFSGKTVEKLGPDHYRVYNGSITTCELPHPKWRFSAGEIVVDVGGNATVYNSLFRIHGVPIFYFPAATHPVNREARKTGLLIPNIGRSSIKGNILGESLYWSLGRSMDATVGAEYFSKRGWAPQGEFRAQPGLNSFLDLNYFAVLDRGIAVTDSVTGAPKNNNQGGAEVKLNAEGHFPYGFRGVADIDYLTSYEFRVVFLDAFTQAINSEVKSQAFLTNNSNNFFFNIATRRYQDFEGTQTGNVITILHAPSFDIGGVDRRLGRSPFYWSFNAAAEGLSRSEPSFRTATLLGRLDLRPTLSAPFSLHGWDFRPEISVRETYYTQRFGAPGGVTTATDDPISRKALEGAVELRPPGLTRIFDRQILGRKWKHVIEPQMTYRYVTGVNNFPEILRFDERDILSDTNEVEYSLVNRLYAKRVSGKPTDCGPAGMPALLIGGQSYAPRHAPWEKTEAAEAPCSAEQAVREVVTWELAQKYFLDPTFGGALIPGQRNVFTTTADLTGIAFLTDARHLSPITSRLRVQTSVRSDAEWDLDYDFRAGRISASTALINYRIGPFTVGGGDAFLQVPETNTPSAPIPGQRFNQFRTLFGYGHANKRGFSGASTLGFDANLGQLQYGAVQLAYNWDCCGVSLEYRRFNLTTLRRENQFRFSFALANIGALGNLRRQDRLF